MDCMKSKIDYPKIESEYREIEKGTKLKEPFIEFVGDALLLTIIKFIFIKPYI